MVGAIDNAILFLINTAFTLFLYILAIRLILVYVGANYYDPITQFVVKFTDFIVKPIRKIIPNIKRLETSTLVLILVFEYIKFGLIFYIGYHMPNPIGLAIVAIGDTLNMLIMMMFYAIIAHIVLSWIQPYSPMMQILNKFTSPIMTPIRKLVPVVGGFDISPIPAMIGLQLLVILIANPIMMYGQALAL